MAMPAASGPPPRAARGLNDRKSRAERWEELLDAAADIFCEKGYDGTSLKEIAAKVGILKGSIYYYIDTKADLRDNLLVKVHADGVEMIRSMQATEGDALVKLEAMIRGHIEHSRRNLTRITMYLQELKKLTPQERRELLGPDVYPDAFLEVVELGRSEGTLLSDLDPKLSVDCILGALNSVYQWHGPGKGFSDRALADHFTATLLRGYATPEAYDRHVERSRVPAEA